MQTTMARWKIRRKYFVLLPSILFALIFLLKDSKDKGYKAQVNAAPVPSTAETIAVHPTSDKQMFASIDISADGNLSKKEIMWMIQRKVAQHMQSALQGNMRKFFALDSINPNGQVDWEEWRKSLLQGMDVEIINSRAFKEQLSAAKAAWKEAARTNPESLNVDEFLSFTHSEFSHPLRIQEAEDMMSTMDENGDGALSLSEYSSRARSSERELSLKKSAFSDSDVNGDGLLTRNELLVSLDPKGEVWAKQQAQKVIATCDKDNDDFIDINEFEPEQFLPLLPEKMFHEIF